MFVFMLWKMSKTKQKPRLIDISLSCFSTIWYIGEIIYVLQLLFLCSLSLCVYRLCLSLFSFWLNKFNEIYVIHVFTNCTKEKKERNNKQIALCFNCCLKRGKKANHFTRNLIHDIYQLKNCPHSTFVDKIFNAIHFLIF